MSFTRFPDLKEYALNYLAKYSSTENHLIRILNNKVKRWVFVVKKEGLSDKEIEDYLARVPFLISQIVFSMKSVGAIDDAQFAMNRVRTLTRSGNSIQKIKGKLAQRGVPSSIIEEVTLSFREKDTELWAALVFAKKRRIGPFRRDDTALMAENSHKAWHVMSRGGFSFEIVKQVMGMDLGEAEEKMNELQASV
ncbi:Regulatory protein RecX [Commensalibacter sp. Nvir]|uniref:regulatory protein RecX n=1 Tax=Commensalibacter sp. Nvir TaxID=3069817 RepID=UPI002D4D82E8|nr:Regulatory protein RecX [Commensalibacter sp. Nvir]